MDLGALNPQARQLLLARMMQGNPQLAEAHADATSLDVPAVAAQMSNNPALAKAATMAQMLRQKSAAPVQMGQQGFMMPKTGGFVESPMYAEQKFEDRDSREQMAKDRVLAQTQMAQERLAQQAAENERNRQLRMTLAAMTDTRARDLHQPKSAPKGKSLPGSEIRKISDMESLAGAVGDLSRSFKDDFGGGGAAIIKNTQNFLGRNQPLGMGEGYADQANWWQNYNEQANKIRHALFGSALTATEKAAFEKAVITEGMASDEIKRRLAQQHRAAVQAYNKIKANYGKGGYEMGEFEDLPVPAEALPGAPVKPKSRVRIDANGDIVP